MRWRTPTEQPTFGRKLGSSLETTSRKSKGKAVCCTSGAIILWCRTRTTPSVVRALLWKGSPMSSCKEFEVAANQVSRELGMVQLSPRLVFSWLVCCVRAVSQQLFLFLLFRQGDVKKKKKKKKGKLSFLAVDTTQLHGAHQIVSSNSQLWAPQELEPFARTGFQWAWIFVTACLDESFFHWSESSTLIGSLCWALCTSWLLTPICIPWWCLSSVNPSLISWHYLVQESCLRTMTPRWLLTPSGGFQCGSVPTIVAERRARRRIRLARGLRVQLQLAPLNCKYPLVMIWENTTLPSKLMLIIWAGIRFSQCVWGLTARWWLTSIWEKEVLLK